MSINITINVAKKSFAGWIQDYKYSESDEDSTIQKVLVKDGTSTFEMHFDDFDEWKKFLKLFNVTDITDVRKTNKAPIH